MSATATTIASRAATALRTWPVQALFAWFPLWWALGLGGFIWLIVPTAMVFMLTMAPRVRVPRGFGIWLLFLAWVLVSATQLDDLSSGMVFTYRFGLYAGAGVLLLYVYNLDRSQGTSRRVVQALAAMWLATAICGLAGLVLPHLSLTTITEAALPKGLLDNAWVRDMVHLKLAESNPPRVSAPFTYTNEWGANFALLAPFALLAAMRTRRPSPWWPAILAVSLLPLLISTNRGAWISLAVAVVYAVLRMSPSRRLRIAVALGTVAGIGLLVLTTTSLSHTIESGLSSRESNQTRASIYEQTMTAVKHSPVVGYGSPRPSSDPTAPPLGTHGQLWMAMFSHGIPGAALYVGFLLTMFVRTRRARSPVGRAANATILMAIVQLTFYGALPAQLFIVMAAAALALREVDAPRPLPRPRPVLP